ncbi:MAG: hypothetical protein BGN91_00845 [Nitrobacter sp. 62-13]|uniref:hypothetical protein n=1 Tax=Nitrobacter sp. 62-13 TaxID=1895797 RepID=UPI000965002D|nr:hypothetical protein [Nitrobacter sp. 62-13]OJU26807.1 MAG: hypothetical protein BGN91_00845 [Nitrobacter sp. 62-13]
MADPNHAGHDAALRDRHGGQRDDLDEWAVDVARDAAGDIGELFVVRIRSSESLEFSNMTLAPVVVRLTCHCPDQIAARGGAP